MSLDDLLMQEFERDQLVSLANSPPHGLLICGPTGLGKATVALAWAQIIADPTDIAIIQPDEKGLISIETTRSLYAQTRSKRQTRQVVIIKDANSMSIEAQNAFLKLLEEPTEQVVFVLTAPTTETLLPTVISRLQQVGLSRLANEQLETLIVSRQPTPSAQDKAQMLFIANGRPGLLVRVLDDPTAFTAERDIMQLAKRALTSPSYERLAMVTELAKDRRVTIEVLEAMAHILQSQLMRDPQPRWLAVAERLETCLMRMAQNGSARAQLSALFLAY